MSYDLMVLEPLSAPREPRAFFAWFKKVAEWGEPHSYDDPAFTTPTLRAWYHDMIKTLPAMNGPDASPNVDSDLITGYTCASTSIYCDFRWSRAEFAYDHVKTLARKHRLGFFDVSDTGDVWLPGKDGSYAVAFRAAGPG